jgi:hypothetical protein
VPSRRTADHSAPVIIGPRKLDTCEAIAHINVAHGGGTATALATNSCPPGQ